MHLSDSINGIFEAGGAILMWLNVKRIIEHKQVRGIDWRITVFFSAWGFWNLWYYPSLHQWMSFIGGIVMVTANIVWLVLAIKYRNN